MTGLWRALGASPLLVILAACGSASPPTIGSVEALDVRIVVRPDGGLDVDERLRIAPESARIRMRRLITTPYADDVVFGSAAVDTRPVEPGDAGLTVEAAEGDVLAIALDRTAVEAPVDVSARYAVTAAVAVREPRGRLAWQVLEADRDFDVGSVTVTLDVPDGVAIYDGTGMAEAGWDVAVADRRVTAQRGRVPAGEAATLLAVFDVDRSRVQRGTWEWNLDRRQEYGLALLAAGAFVIVVGLGILVQLRAQYPPPGRDAPDEVWLAAVADRRMLSRGLMLSAGVSLVAAGGFAMAARWWMAGLEPAVHAIPGGMVVVVTLFVAAAWWYGRTAARASRTRQ